MLNCIVLFTVVLLLILSCNAERVVRVLSLGGGGDRGAYEVGVLRALIELQEDSKSQYDIVSGISVGALNSACFGQFEKGQEKEAINFLVKLWKNTRKDDVYANWIPGGILSGFTIKPGLFNSSPLKKYIEKNFSLERLRRSGRHVVVGTTNFDLNKFEGFNETSDDFPDAVLGSASIPGVFPPQKIGSYHYVDGGASYMTPISSAIETAKRLYGPDVKVTVDVVLALGDSNYPHALEDILVTPFILLKSAFGVVQNIFVGDIQNARVAFPNAQIRVIKPSQWLKGWFLGFDHTQEMMDLGFHDGAAAINSTASIWW